MSRKSVSIVIDAEALRHLASRVDSLTVRGVLGLAAVDAVNAVARRADTSLRRGENRDINLTDAYIEARTTLAPALTQPTATIRTRGDLTILGHYPRQQLTQAASKRAKGDPSRGIAAGTKQAGLQVSIKRSAAVSEPRWFTMRLRAGSASGSKTGVFVRDGDKVQHIYGPSPYSLFRHQVGAQESAIADDLTRNAVAAVADRVEKTLR